MNIAVRAKMEETTSTCKRNIKNLFAILDRFNRDALYKSLDVELNFVQCAEDFCVILGEVLGDKDRIKTDGEYMSSSQLATCELSFRDYAEIIENSPNIKIKTQYRGILKRNQNEITTPVWDKWSLLFFACSQAIPTDRRERESLRAIIDVLIENCPEMIIHPTMSGNDTRHGPTPLHLMVVKEATTKPKKDYKHGVIEHMLLRIASAPETRDQNFDLDKFNLKGEMARGSLLRAKTLLNIAARTLDMETIELLLKGPATEDKYQLAMDSYNEYKDNIYHSLIRYTIFYPEKEKDVKYVMEKIEVLLNKKSTQFIVIDSSKKGKPDSLWMMKNRENLTPLQLSAKLGRFEIFKFILNRKVYRLNADDRGNFDDESYDVTEIETIPTSGDNDRQTNEEKQEDIKMDTKRHISALHLLEQYVSSENSARFVSLNVVARLISDKWYAYRKWVLIWALIHLIVMILYTWQAIVRSRLRNPITSQSATIPEYDNVAFVIASSSITVVYGLLCFVLQCRFYYRYCYGSRKSCPFFAYAHAFSLLSVGVFLDFFLMLFVSSYENFILPFTLILGWYLAIFFLHVIEHLSFFSILIKEVIKHLIQFGIVLSALLIGFSTAMFVVMQNAEDIEEDTFENIEKTIVKMFTIMLGIGELGVLFNARQPALAIAIFVLFVLLTTILLLNALIAIMSNTCSALTDEASKKTYVRLHRMYTIIHLEAMLPQCLLSAAKQVSRLSHSKPGDIVTRRILCLRPEDDDKPDRLDAMEGTAAEKIMMRVANYAFSSKRRRKTKPAQLEKHAYSNGTQTLRRTAGITENTLDIYETTVRP